MPAYVSSSKFEDTENKQVVRKQLDLPVIQELSGRYPNSKMAYFGLPGANAHDVVDWLNYISSVDAVERWRFEKLQLEGTLTRLRLDGDSRVYLRKFEDHLADQNPDDMDCEIRTYGIINLDFEGPISSGGGEVRDTRLRMVEKLLRIQRARRNPNFIFLLTIYARRASNEDLREACEDALGNVNTGSSNASSFFEYAMKVHNQRIYLALSVPVWILRYALINDYTAECKHIVFYKGSKGSPMAHFIFMMELECDRALPRLVDPHVFKRLPLNKIIEVKDGKTQVLDLGFPEFKE